MERSLVRAFPSSFDVVFLDLAIHRSLTNLQQMSRFLPLSASNFQCTLDIVLFDFGQWPTDQRIRTVNETLTVAILGTEPRWSNIRREIVNVQTTVFIEDDHSFQSIP